MPQSSKDVEEASDGDDVVFAENSSIYYSKDYKIIRTEPTTFRAIPLASLYSNEESLGAGIMEWKSDVLNTYTANIILPLPSSYSVVNISPKYQQADNRLKEVTRRSKINPRNVPLSAKSQMALLDVVITGRKIDESMTFPESVNRQQIKYTDKIENVISWGSTLVPQEPKPYMYDTYEDYLSATKRWTNALNNLELPLHPECLPEVIASDPITGRRKNMTKLRKGRSSFYLITQVDDLVFPDYSAYSNVPPASPVVSALQSQYMDFIRNQDFTWRRPPEFQTTQLDAILEGQNYGFTKKIWRPGPLYVDYVKSAETDKFEGEFSITKVLLKNSPPHAFIKYIQKNPLNSLITPKDIHNLIDIMTHMNTAQMYIKALAIVHSLFSIDVEYIKELLSSQASTIKFGLILINAKISAIYISKESPIFDYAASLCAIRDFMGSDPNMAMSLDYLLQISDDAFHAAIKEHKMDGNMEILKSALSMPHRYVHMAFLGSSPISTFSIHFHTNFDKTVAEQVFFRFWDHALGTYGGRVLSFDQIHLCLAHPCVVGFARQCFMRLRGTTISRGRVLAALKQFSPNTPPILFGLLPPLCSLLIESSVFGHSGELEFDASAAFVLVSMLLPTTDATFAGSIFRALTTLLPHYRGAFAATFLARLAECLRPSVACADAAWAFAGALYKRDRTVPEAVWAALQTILRPETKEKALLLMRQLASRDAADLTQCLAGAVRWRVFKNVPRDRELQSTHNAMMATLAGFGIGKRSHPRFISALAI